MKGNYQLYFWHLPFSQLLLLLWLAEGMQTLRGEDDFTDETSSFGGTTIMGTLPSYMLETYEEAVV